MQNTINFFQISKKSYTTLENKNKIISFVISFQLFIEELAVILQYNPLLFSVDLKQLNYRPYICFFIAVTLLFTLHIPIVLFG